MLHKINNLELGKIYSFKTFYRDLLFCYHETYLPVGDIMAKWLAYN